MSTVDADWHGMGDGEDKDKPVSKGIPQSRALDHVTERPRVLVDFPYILSCPCSSNRYLPAIGSRSIGSVAQALSSPILSEIPRPEGVS